MHSKKHHQNSILAHSHLLKNIIPRLANSLLQQQAAKVMFFVFENLKIQKQKQKQKQKKQKNKKKTKKKKQKKNKKTKKE